MIMEEFQGISERNTSKREKKMSLEGTDSIQSHRRKISEYAERYGIDLLFREDIQMNKTFLTLKWISGETSTLHLSEA